ncbi:MAG: phosphopantetheine-binding protein [Marinobacter sp.]|jgi:acyl carrier protein|uniref:phosphopantetheine-binding protein n=1 Tax=Marinobacter sp. TaxID=50741 RepID=UPI002B26945A|nr:phosphopantetheine-binding protein [Marinobacter sp.]
MSTNRHTAIQSVLQQHLPNARLSAFAGSARLNADLAIDSIMLLQLIVHLELEHGFNLPEETLLTQELETVDDLARLLVANDQKEPSL